MNSPGPPRPNTARRALFFGIAAGLVAFVLLVNTPDRGILWSAVFDAGHALLFGLFALVVLGAISTGRGPTGDATGSVRIRTCLVAFTVTGVFAGLSEILQGLGSRDAELWDFVRDLLGGAAVLLLALACDRRAGQFPSRRRAFRVTLALTAAALLATAFLRVTTVAIAYLFRDAAFPRICEFDGRWESEFVGVTNAVLARGEPPAGWGRKVSDRAGRVTFLPARYPGLSIQEPHPDWTGYNRLEFEVYSESRAQVCLNLRIDDVHHNNDYADRFNRALVVEPGPNRISISLEDVRRGPVARPMDMAHVRGLTLFAVGPPQAFSVYLDGFRLER
jgi:hypothetical protein